MGVWGEMEWNGKGILSCGGMKWNGIGTREKEVREHGGDQSVQNNIDTHRGHT